MVDTETGCWLWTGSLDWQGYGRFRRGSRGLELAHRVAWEIYRGPIAEGAEITQTCRVHPCVSPEHLAVSGRGQVTIERLLERVRIDPENGCWLWVGALDDRGYPIFPKSGDHAAHRVAWRLYRGEIPTGAAVKRTCGGRICVNPEHLALGTRGRERKAAAA